MVRVFTEIIANVKKSLEPAGEIWRTAKKTFLSLNFRERILVSMAGGVILILFLDLSVLAPVSRMFSRLDRQIEKARKDLREMYILQEEHTRLEDRLKGLKPIPKDFSFLHHLESIGTQSGVKIDSIKPGPTTSLGTMKEMTYDVRIEKVGLYQLVDLLYKIEKNQDYPMRVKRITVRPQQRERQFLEVSFQVVTVSAG